jgi:hypothetical protein
MANAVRRLRGVLFIMRSLRRDPPTRTQVIAFLGVLGFLGAWWVISGLLNPGARRLYLACFELNMITSEYASPGYARAALPRVSTRVASLGARAEHPDVQRTAQEAAQLILADDARAESALEDVKTSCAEAQR